MLGCLLFALFLPVWILVNESVWRSRSRRQASIYLRSSFLKWIHRDLRMIIKKKLKARRKQIRALNRVEPKDESV